MSKITESACGIVSYIEKKVVNNKGDQYFNIALLGAAKDTLFLYDQLNRDEEGQPLPFSVQEWYENYLLKTDTAFLDASRVRIAAYAYTDDSVISADDARLGHVRKVWSKLDESERNKLRLVALNVLADHGREGLSGSEAIWYANFLRAIRGMVHPFIHAY